MKLLKKSDRHMKSWDMVKAMKVVGGDGKDLGRWCKWKEVHDGRLQVKMDIFELVQPDGVKFYILSDSLDRVACPIVTDKNEVLSWLKEHGYKPEKQWYMEEAGMTEELWNEWNSAE